MKNTRQIIRELVEEVIEEMTGTGAVGGGAGPIRSRYWGRKNTKSGKDATGVSGYTVVPGYEEKSTVEEDEKNIVRREMVNEARSRYINFRESDMMKNHAKVSYGLLEAKKMLREVEYLIKICERLKTECGYTNENLWSRTRSNLIEIAKCLKEISKRINRIGN